MQAQRLLGLPPSQAEDAERPAAAAESSAGHADAGSRHAQDADTGGKRAAQQRVVPVQHGQQTVHVAGSPSAGVDNRV